MLNTLELDRSLTAPLLIPLFSGVDSYKQMGSCCRCVGVGALLEEGETIGFQAGDFPRAIPSWCLYYYTVEPLFIPGL